MISNFRQALILKELRGIKKFMRIVCIGGVDFLVGALKRPVLLVKILWAHEPHKQLDVIGFHRSVSV